MGGNLIATGEQPKALRAIGSLNLGIGHKPYKLVFTEEDSDDGKELDDLI